MVLALGRERAQEDLQQAAAGLQVPPVLLVPREQAALLVVQAQVLPALQAAPVPQAVRVLPPVLALLPVVEQAGKHRGHILLVPFPSQKHRTPRSGSVLWPRAL